METIPARNSLEELLNYTTIEFKNPIADDEARKLLLSMAKPLKLDTLERWPESSELSVKVNDTDYTHEDRIMKYTGKMTRSDEKGLTLQLFSLKQSYSPQGWTALTFDVYPNETVDELSLGSRKLIEETREYIRQYFSKP